MLAEKILSVGIDIGTTTTQLIFSYLSIENTASDFAIPKINIIDREIVYQSEIYITPLISETLIDIEKIKKIFEKEYQKAKIVKEEIVTGAVIITGETARKENAELVLSHLSNFAGDFVVATAGPELESILAGKGAGADRQSLESHEIVASVDIGGGTTNIAVFKNGEVIDTCCLDIGGRLIKFEPNSRKVAYLSKSVEKLISQLSLAIAIGYEATDYDLAVITNHLSDVIAESLGRRPPSHFLQDATTNGKALRLDYTIDQIMFSGGVADCMYYPERFTERTAFQDIGILLGETIASSKWLKECSVVKSLETIRATVVGAGNHTTTISGSTIYYSESLLPLKNIPVCKINLQDEALPQEERIELMKEKISWFKEDELVVSVALAMTASLVRTYEDAETLAKVLLAGGNELLKHKLPLIVVLEKDVGKILGLLLKKMNHTNAPIICLDSVTVSDGDYIDIGKPLAGGKVLPVVIKTLALGYN